ncbi:MAG: hemolysin family protein [Haloferacaceae archaeon]
MVLSGSFLYAGLGVVVVLLALSAFFSGSEIAVFSLERHRVDALLDAGAPGGETLSRLRTNPHRLLVTVLVGNNIVNIAMASIATFVLTALLGPGVGLTVATVGMSFLVLVFGEITPKSYGVANAESFALRVAGPLSVIQAALYPLVVFFEGVSRGINRLTGGEMEIERPYMTRQDLETLLQTGRTRGVIDEDEHEMVQGVFDLSSTIAREVMVPRVNVVAVDVGTPIEEVIEVCSTERLTRVPVYDGTLDHVVGIADIRDAERAAREGRTLREALLPVYQVPDTREIDDLLAEMQEGRVPMVVVRDEFGETEGIVTVEDILEEIVGEIFETGEERRIRWRDGDLLVNGEVTIGEVNDAFEASLPREGEFETVAGLINDQLGRIGDVGDEVVVGDVSLRVESVEGNRITRVCVRRRVANSESEFPTGEGELPTDEGEAPGDEEREDRAGDEEGSGG